MSINTGNIKSEDFSNEGKPTRVSIVTLTIKRCSLLVVSHSCHINNNNNNSINVMLCFSQTCDEVKKNEQELLALKAQVKIYAEDFEKERKNCEKAQSRISDLESEILNLKHLQEPSYEPMPMKSYYTPKSTRYFKQKEAVPRTESHYVDIRKSLCESCLPKRQL